MALELFMVGLIVQDMSKAQAFYRQLGLDIPQGIEDQTHVEVKMGSGLTLFLDSRPTRWDPEFVRRDTTQAVDGSPVILEFYLKSRENVEEKYRELIGSGYQGYRAPYATSFGMCFAMVNDPDGNTILLSGDLAKDQAAQAQ